MRPSVTTVLAILLAGCSDRPPVLQSPASTASARCIQLDQVVGRRVAGPSSVLFEMNGPVDYRNELPRDCPGLERLGATATISIASGGGGGQLCRGDRIRVADPVEAKATGLTSYPTCVLGDFTAIAVR